MPKETIETIARNRCNEAFRVIDGVREDMGFLEAGFLFQAQIAAAMLVVTKEYQRRGLPKRSAVALASAFITDQMAEFVLGIDKRLDGGDGL